MDVPVARLVREIGSKDALIAALISNGVPEMISSVLLEWHHRAQGDIESFDQKAETDFLENILAEFVTRPWLKQAHG
jgi:hypothetical protein